MTTRSRRPVLAAAALSFAALAALLPAGVASAAAPDVPGAPAQVTASSPQGRWLSGDLSSAKDVDAFRFTTTAARWTRVLLGDLPADYRLTLLDARGRVVRTSDRPGRQAEEVYVELPAGTWFVRVDAVRGKAAGAYSVSFTGLPDGLRLLSHRAVKHPTAGEIVVEVLNNSDRAIDGIGWLVKDLEGCVDDRNLVCTSQGLTGMARTVPARARASFFIDWPLEAVGHRYSLSVQAGAPTASKVRVSVVSTSTSGSTVSGRMRITGGPACTPVPVRSAYGPRDELLGQFEVWLRTGYYRVGTQPFSTKDVPLPAGTRRVSWSAYDHSAGDPECAA